EEVDFSSEEKNPNVGMLLRSKKDGVIKEIINKNKMEDEDIEEIFFDYGIGERVQEFRVGPHRIGHVIVTSATVKAAREKMEEVLNKIEIIVE
ncbi:MAG: carboxylate--amine ligase, partial [Lachnospiraceae bacterium]|nr:carboxylate--amine ligase [Lachnospiraceae bacterium]